MTITGGKAFLHEEGSVTAALEPRINADEGKIPVRLTRMKCGHLFEQEENFRKPRMGHVRFEEVTNRLVIRVNGGWQPLRNATEITNDIGGAVVKRFATEERHERYEYCDELQRVGPGPPGRRIGAKCHRHGSFEARLIRSRGPPNLRGV